MTPSERATDLINQWLEDGFGLPLTVSLSRLGLRLVAAFEQVEREAYERGRLAALEELSDASGNQNQD